MDEQQPQADPDPFLACTISRDIRRFDLLIEDMESVMGTRWGDLGFAEALSFLDQPEAGDLQFVAIAVGREDEADLSLASAVAARARTRGIGVILIAAELSPAALHRLLRKGAAEFVPYPLPEGELQDAVARLRTAAPQMPHDTANPHSLHPGSTCEGAVIVAQGLAGGVGATTLATNLAWELALLSPEDASRVCLVDLGLQFGSVSTYLDLPRREAVLDVLMDMAQIDEDSLGAALTNYEDRLQVLTAPADLVPLDLVAPNDVQRLIDMARQHFDYVVIDMPQTLMQWSETVLHAAHVHFALIELDMRSAQNVLRLKQALQAEDLPFHKLRFALNRAPRFTDLNGRSRVRRMAESLGINIDLLLPDGGKQVAQGCDNGTPLARSAARNPLRREIMKLARSLHAIGQDAEKAA